MKLQLYKLFFAAAFSMTLLACDEDENENIVSINKLEAKAGPDRQVTIDTEVKLDGSTSNDGNNKPFTYQWTFMVKPVNSLATLSGQATATPEFTPDVAGLYVIELKIIQGEFFKTDQVSITAVAPPSNTPTPVVLNEDISSDRILEDVFEDPASADYVVKSNIIVSAKLTINPGVVIAFEADKILHVYPQGTLIAKGTNTAQIFFTGQTKIRGFWGGILLSSNSADNEIDNVNVEYAGSINMPEMVNAKAGIALSGNSFSGAALKVSNSSFNENGGYGLYVQGMSELNYFSGNYFNNNSASAAYVPARQLHKLDLNSHYTGNNGYNGIETGGIVDEDAEVIWGSFNDGSKYFVSGDISVRSGVKITEGAEFEFGEGVAVQVVDEGYLDAEGTALKPISFSARTKTHNKYWNGILFTTGNELNRLHYTTISHAGLNEISGMNLKANVSVTASGKVTVSQSTFSHGLGWGIAVAQGALINNDITTSNLFNDLAEGNLNLPATDPETTTLAGEWVDQWSFNNAHYTVNETLYNPNDNIWFNGSIDPWSMNAPGFGLKINEDGSYTWTIADRSLWTGDCISYSAEYITGNVTQNGNELSFQESYWRSKFYSPCNPDANVDTNVQPGGMVLRYEISQEHNTDTGSDYWKLKIINPDDSFFTYYRQ